MENEIVVTTLDKRIDVKVIRYAGYLRFTIGTHGETATLANSKNYAFQDEAVEALRARGSDYADEMIESAVAALDD